MKIEVVWEYWKDQRLHYVKMPVEITGIDETSFLRRMTLEVNDMSVMSIPFYFHEMTPGYHTMCTQNGIEQIEM